MHPFKRQVEKLPQAISSVVITYLPIFLVTNGAAEVFKAALWVLFAAVAKYIKLTLRPESRRAAKSACLPFNDILGTSGADKSSHLEANFRFFSLERLLNATHQTPNRIQRRSAPSPQCPFLR